VDVQPLVEVFRERASDRTWSAGSRLARAGVVRGLGVDDDELRLSVRIEGRPTALTVYLWPDEDDWGCDCGLELCAHAAAALIATLHAQKRGQTLPEAPVAAPRLRYDLRREGRELVLTRNLVTTTGVRPLKGSVRQAQGVHASDADLVAEQVLQLGDRNLPAVGWRRMLAAWAHCGAELALDGEPITPCAEPVPPVAVLHDDGEGYRLSLHRSAEVEETFRGQVVRVGRTLRPASDGGLESHHRAALTRGLAYGREDEGRLVSEILPKLRQTLTVKVKTGRLPRAVVDVPPRAVVELQDVGERGLGVRAQVVYGDPVLARVEGERLVRTGTDVVVRQPRAEAELRRRVDRDLLIPVGRRWHFDGEDAVRFVRDRLPRFRGEVRGDPGRWRVRKEPARVGLEAVAGGSGVRLTGEADPGRVVKAWREGRSLVPLLDGGWAPLPRRLLEQHGELLADLVAAGEDDGTVPRHAVGPAAELARALDHPPPAALEGLQALIDEGHEGLPEARLPEGLTATLRTYQGQGVAWIQTLQRAGLGGVLADDMGLGKTLQALCATDGVEGPVLVVAPTSVLRNWAAEIDRFLPGRSVCVFHGPRRSLDPEARFTITSYALLRLDPELLEPEWGAVVLDEAQAIKNPESQTARAARSLQAPHRLCLTGTPVENRLEELWSQLHFLMPGFLGGRADFRERYALPLERGDRRAAASLRRRIGPFVLRRLKQEVARDLPPRTDITLRIPLGEEQRSIYAAVRESGRAVVQQALASHRTLDVLEHLLRLRQAACHTGLLPGDRPAHSAKLDQLVEALDEVTGRGHKALVFSQWTSFLDRIEEAVSARGMRWTRLDGSTRDRQAVVDGFQAEDGPPVFLLSLKAGGTGLNLTAADYVFHTDPWWNPAVEAQATDRAHRIGQDKPVVSVKLIAEDTVEERIADLQEAKKALAEAVVGEAALLGRLTAADLRDLLAEG